MKPFVRNSVVLAFAGALAASAATPVLAGDLAGPGFARGPVAANSYYGPRDYRSVTASERSYVVEPSYASERRYVVEPSYAYEPGTTYLAPAPQVVYRPSTCWVNTDKDRGFGYWGSCASSGAILAR